MTVLENATSHDGAKVSEIMNRLSDLLDVEWRILEQAKYDLLPDITQEKNKLQDELHGEISAQRNDSLGNALASLIVDFDKVKELRAKLARNNIRLQAKREACLKRIRAGWAATASHETLSYDREGDVRGGTHQRILSIKM